MALTNQNKVKINKTFVKNKSILIKTRLAETLSASTIHGLPNIVRSDKCITKFIWLICFLISSAWCFYLVAESIFAYLKFDVVTTVRVIDEPYSEFPRIMFCDKHNLNTNFTLEHLRNISNDNLFNHNLSLFQKKLNIEKLKSNLISSLNNLNREEQSRSGQRLDEILISCKFGSSECKPSDFEWFLHPYNGICHIFNAGKNFSNGEQVPLKVSHKPGYFNGLEIELYLGKKNKLKELSHGLQLVIANNSDSFVSNVLMNIPIGFEVNIQLDRLFVNQLPCPYSDCKIDSSVALETFDSPLTKIFFRRNTTYRQSHCLEYCFQLNLLKECNCTEYNLDSNVKSKICLNETEVNCVYEYFEKVFVKDDFIQKNCIPLCPYECKRVKIRKVFSTNKYPSDDYTDILKDDVYLKENVFKNDNWTHIKENVLKMNIFYEELSYISITENPSMTIVDLISNIGGSFFVLFIFELTNKLKLFHNIKEQWASFWASAF
jgi:hypothetical protein